MAKVISTGATNKPNNPYYTTGKKIKEVGARFSVAAADVADGDNYILAQGLSYADRVDSVVMEGGHVALAASADNDLGFYEMDEDGNLTEIDKDILVDGFSFVSARTAWTDLLNLNASLDREKNIGELVDKSVEQQVDNLCLVLTTNTKSTATNTVLNVKSRVECANTN